MNMEPDWNEERLSAEHVDRLIMRNVLPVILWAFIGLVAGFVYLMVAQPRYTAQAGLLLETETSLIGDVQTLYLDLDTHAQLIQTEGIVAEVIRRLDLQEDPRFDPSSSTLQNVLNFSRARFSQPLLGEVRHLDGSEVVAAGDRNATMRDAILARVPKVSDDLTILREGDTRLLALSFTSDDPELSARIANAFAEVYVEHLARIGSDEGEIGGPALSEGTAVESNDDQRVAVTFTKEDAFEMNAPERAGLFDDLRIVSRATVPTSHSTPNIKIVLMAFLLLGLLIGLLRAARREWSQAS